MNRTFEMIRQAGYKIADEKRNLDRKIRALRRFVTSNKATLPRKSVSMLNKQLRTMTKYSKILKKRLEKNIF